MARDVPRHPQRSVLALNRRVRRGKSNKEITGHTVLCQYAPLRMLVSLCELIQPLRVVAGHLPARSGRALRQRGHSEQRTQELLARVSS